MGPIEQALQLIERYGLALVALVCVSLFAVWVTRLLFAEQRRVNDAILERLDRSLDITERQVAATVALTAVVNQALDNRGELMRLLEEAVGRLSELARRPIRGTRG